MSYPLRRFLVTALLALGTGCIEAGDHAGNDSGADADAAPYQPGLTWKAVLMAGDYDIDAFDNAREALYSLFVADGLLDAHVRMLSRDPRLLLGDVRDTSVPNFERALRELDVQEREGCAVFMTSHGFEDGWYIRDREPLTPLALDAILDATCGVQPTVVLISGCYSGIFVLPVSAPNRVVLTASAADRTSFGCDVEAAYAVWDGCVIDHFEAAVTWEGLHERASTCVAAQETASGLAASIPQGFFGEEVRRLAIFGRR